MTKQKIKWLGICLLIITTVFVWIAVQQSMPASKLNVTFLDVGQGDAILIETPRHRQLLLDVGPGSAVLTPLSQSLPFFDHSINLVLLSHGDSDHSGGLADLKAHYSLDYFLVGHWAKKDSVLNQEPLSVEIGTRLTLEPGIYLDILQGGATVKKDNTDSLVALLRYGSTTFLFDGDATAGEEAKVAEDFSFLAPVDVLKVAHHGSRTSSQLTFLQTIRPKYAVISVGAKNRYGHPTAETLARLKQVGAEILRTDELGTIVFETDGRSLVRR